MGLIEAPSVAVVAAMAEAEPVVAVGAAAVVVNVAMVPSVVPVAFWATGSK